MTSNDNGQPPERGRANWLYEQQRRRIEIGVWPHDSELPSEDDMEFKPMSEWLTEYEPTSEEQPSVGKDGRKRYMSKRMARDPAIRLAAIGRVIMRQGKVKRVYMPGMERHRLVVDLPKPSSTKLYRVAEPDEAEPHTAVELIQAYESKVGTRWHEGEYEYTVPAWDSERLGIDAGTKLSMYTRTLLIDGEPILISKSLVREDLLTGAVKWQQNSENPIGELALTGVSVTFSYPTLHSRVPTLDEAEALDSVDGIPAFAVYRQCRVTPLEGSATPRRACVLIVARADRVHL